MIDTATATRAWSTASVQTAEKSLLEGRRAGTSVAHADGTSVTESALVCYVKQRTLLCLVVLELWVTRGANSSVLYSLRATTIRAHPELLVRFRIRLVRLLQVVVPSFLQLEVFLRTCGIFWSEGGSVRYGSSDELTSELFLEHCKRRLVNKKATSDHGDLSYSQLTSA